jgi:hypothetical protein
MPGVRIAPQFLVRRAAIELYNEAFGAIECIAWADTDDNPEAVADNGASMEPSGRNRWQLFVNAAAPNPARRYGRRTATLRDAF